MNIFRKTIKKGITFSAYRTDMFKSCVFDLSFVLPLNAENASYASLLGNLLTRPTEKHPTRQSLSILKDELYALSAVSYTHRNGELLVLSFRLNATADSFAFDGEKILEGALSLLGEMIFCPKTENGVFPEDETEDQKRFIINDIRSIIEDKPAYAMKRTREMLCEGEPFSVNALGDEEIILKATPEKIFGFYKKVISSAPIFFTYAGEAEEEYVITLAEKYLPFGERDAFIPSPTDHLTKTEVNRVTEPGDYMEQCIITLGFGREGSSSATPRERAVIAVFDELLGGLSGKLFMNVREKEGLCYFCSSNVPAAKNVAFIQSGVAPGTENEALNAIYNELYAMQSGDFTEKDMDIAKRSLINSLNALGGHLGTAATYMLGKAIRGEEGETDMAALVRDIKKAEVTAFAKTVKPELEYILGGDGE